MKRRKAANLPRQLTALQAVTSYFGREVDKRNEPQTPIVSSILPCHQAPSDHQAESARAGRPIKASPNQTAVRVSDIVMPRTGTGSEPLCGLECLSLASALGSYRITPPERRYATVIRDFNTYLASTAACKFKIHKTVWNDEQQTPDETNRTIEYIHRWTPIYRKAVMAKFYQLEKWYDTNPTPLTLMTLTTYQDGDYSVSMKGDVTTIEEGFEVLKKGWKWLAIWLYKHHPEIKNVWIMEPHQTGYPHMHVILFGTLPESSRIRIKDLWSNKYTAGSEEHGVDFRDLTEIKSIKNYLIKYIAKTLKDGKTNTEKTKYPNVGEHWTRGERLFNAIMWRNHWRLWGASQSLSKIMAYTPDDTDIMSVCDYTELIDEHGESHLTYQREGYEIPKYEETEEKDL